jgi:uncharacterized membrane protein
MSRHKSLLSNLLIVMQVFLLLFCFVDLGGSSRYLLFAGKFHPVILHIPIALMILIVPFSLYLQFNKRHEIERGDDLFSSLFEGLLYSVALICTATGILGFFLAAVGNYDQDSLRFHKWLGLALALSTHALIYVRKAYSTNFKVWNASLFLTLVLMIAGSHFGGTLTHGEGFFTFQEASKTAINIPIFSEKTTVYSGAVQPILTAKCAICHNDQKTKGGLNMKSIELMLKGGKTGAMWVSGDPDNSLMIERMLLDMDDKNHMPPKGKAQLSSTEITLFKEWIKAGADSKKTYHSLAETDTLKKIVAKLIATTPKKADAKTYDFSAASASSIAKLNSPFRRIIPISANSPALSVKFFLKEKFNINLLNECKEVGDQVVELSLSSMPIDDKVFQIISSFPNLEKLNLNTTAITGNGIKELAGLKKLEQLSLAGTPIEIDDLLAISQMSSLKNVFLWNTKINEADIKTLKGSSPKIRWDLGSVTDKAEMLQLAVPFPADRDRMILQQEQFVTLKNTFPSATIWYTTDGTTPDSINGKIYKSPILAKGLLRIKAISTAEGWNKSDVTDFTFFQKGIKCDSVKLLSNPNRGKSFGAKILIDLEKGYSKTGDQLYTSWLGFRKEPFKAGFYFSNKEMHEVVLSIADITKASGSAAFPPTKIIIKGGLNSKKMTVIGTVSPEMPTEGRPNASIPYVVPIKTGTYAYIEIEMQTVQSLPIWHQEKKSNGWVFVDEVFFY